jgi:uncharacterized membrane protein YraQ (UPF0718 family)
LKSEVSSQNESFLKRYLMQILWILTGLALLSSLAVSRKKTIMALRMSFKKLTHILPVFLSLLILVSLVLSLIPDSMISAYLGHENKLIGMLSASLLGSIMIMPGFISYPLCGILLKKQVAYMVLSAFTTTLMMVGIISFPVEKAYFGVRITILRNIISFIIALIVALVTGLVFGELT